MAVAVGEAHIGHVTAVTLVLMTGRLQWRETERERERQHFKHINLKMEIMTVPSQRYPRKSLNGMMRNNCRLNEIILLQAFVVIVCFGPEPTSARQDLLSTFHHFTEAKASDSQSTRTNTVFTNHLKA